VRTREERPKTGAKHTLGAVIWYDIGNVQTFNCFRLIYASQLGLTFSVPQSGPVERTPVVWKGVAGFKAGADRIVQFNVPDNPIQNDGRTDDSGVARMDVEGFGQEQKIPDGALEVQKSATVWLLVQLKESKLGRDLAQAISTAQTGVSFNTALDLLLESLYRTTLLAPTAFTFAVTDWEAGLLIEGSTTQEMEYYDYPVMMDGEFRVLFRSVDDSNVLRGDGTLDLHLDNRYRFCETDKRATTEVPMYAELVGDEILISFDESLIGQDLRLFPFSCEVGHHGIYNFSFPIYGSREGFGFGPNHEWKLTVDAEPAETVIDCAGPSGEVRTINRCTYVVSVGGF
jgi:hypothetical protein